MIRNNRILKKLNIYLTYKYTNKKLDKIKDFVEDVNF